MRMYIGAMNRREDGKYGEGLSGSMASLACSGLMRTKSAPARILAKEHKSARSPRSPMPHDRAERTEYSWVMSPHGRRLATAGGTVEAFWCDHHVAAAAPAGESPPPPRANRAASRRECGRWRGRLPRSRRRCGGTTLSTWSSVRCSPSSVRSVAVTDAPCGRCTGISRDWPTRSTVTGGTMRVHT